MPTDRDLLARIGRSSGGRAGYKQLVRELGLGGGRERRLLLEQLARLTARGSLVKADRDQWSLPQAASARTNLHNNLIAGRLDLHRDGFGFVRPTSNIGTGSENDKTSARGGFENPDIFVPPAELNGAMQGDLVLVELLPPRTQGPNAGKRAGRIVQIAHRRNPTVVGRFKYATSERAQGNYVVPFDERMTQPILIPFGDEVPLYQDDDSGPEATPHRVLGKAAHHAELHPDDLEDMVVDVEITDWPTLHRQARGRVLEVLGHPDDFGVDVEIMIRKHHIPHLFPDAVLENAKVVAHLDQQEIARRLALRHDFRDLPIVTIDGETAKDFDDAVLVRHTRDGYELQVHIADVAQYVVPGSPLDLEARLRGTSVYFPDRAVPMLPQELSSDICSLRPAEDRLVLSCIMQLDRHGAVLSYEVSEGVIRSARRMTYTQVHAILSGDEATRAEFAPLVPAFERMLTLAKILNRKREQRGSIDFDLPEPIIDFNDEGEMQGILRSDRTWANRLIEEFMLSANECVADWHQRLGVASIYRIHEKPDAKRVMDFEETAAHFGYSLGLGALPVKRVLFKSERREFRAHNARNRNSQRSAPREHEIPQDIPVTPQMYQRLAQKIAGKPEERILAHLMLRSLKQARYSEKNEGHFALATSHYTHFTSPIRRYPDLIVHRISKALLDAGATNVVILSEAKDLQFAPDQQSAAPLSEDDLSAIAKECSDNERRAAEAERELMEWKKVKFMQHRIGEDFDAMVMNATKYGLFVELTDLFIEGLVPLNSLLDDIYTYRENTRQIIGAHSGRRFSIGDRLRVILDRVDEVERRLQFSILDQPQPARTGKKKQKPAAKPEPAHASQPKKRGKLRRQPKSKGKRR
ncbi:MAG: ribonuclease [Acidobacteriaceae bacterium]|jgi:ribonuclease R|nr:ribonuclease [Acidobacteriaceae bacterium]